MAQNEYNGWTNWETWVVNLWIDNEWMPEIEGLYLDLLNGAMREINWHEIARHLVERAEEEENYAKQVN